MSGTISMTDEGRDYLAAVRARLADLPAEDRDELLADVEISVHEAAAEGSLRDRLGTPEAFAAELRSAAGFAAPTPSGPEPTGGVLDALRSLVAHVRQDPRAARLRELAPIWWVARAYVAVAALTIATGAEFSEAYPIFPLVVGGPGSLLLLLGAAAASVWIGLERRSGRALWVANAGLALAAAWVALFFLGNPPAREVFVSVPPSQDVGALPLNIAGEPIRNIYPYSRDGRLLHDVLLYDNHGRPLDIGFEISQDPHRRPVESRNGMPVFNAFPIRYFEPGTQTVENPDAAPPVALPEISTPPLERRNR